MTTPTFKARQMRPGHDTIATMAMHYDLPTQRVREIILNAGVPVIREDGFEGTLGFVRTGSVGHPPLGWSDGEAGVDPETTKLTRPAILAVARWRQRQDH